MKRLAGSQGPYGCGSLFPHSFSACKSKSFSMVGQILIVHRDFQVKNGDPTFTQIGTLYQVQVLHRV